MPDPRAIEFERVFRADHVALVAFCFRRIDDHEPARDLTAETFRIAWAKRDEPRTSGHPRFVATAMAFPTAPSAG